MYNRVVDLRNIDWEQSNGILGTNGCYFKTRTLENGTYYYYKLSAYNSEVGFYGHESANEVIVSRLCKILGVSCADYKLEKVLVRLNNMDYETYACKSKSYRSGVESAISIEDFYLENRVGTEDIVSFMHRIGQESFLNKLILIDYMIINRDRHGANLDILSDGKHIRFAPLFDNGLSFICSITHDISNYEDRITKFDALSDLPVNNYIGSRNLFENLKLLSKQETLNALKRSDRQRLFYGVPDILDKTYRDKIWQIITYRYMFLLKRNLIKVR